LNCIHGTSPREQLQLIDQAERLNGLLAANPWSSTTANGGRQRTTTLG
jgi:hypothetical protein